MESSLAIGAVLLLLAVGGCGSREEASPTPGHQTTRHQAKATASPVTEAAPAQQVGGPVAQAPRDVLLPNGVKVPVRAVSTRANGLLDVPEDIRRAGWWRGGARIGDPFGVTLVAGHVDSKTQGLGPYVALLGFRAGQRVVVTTKNLRQTFTISERRLIPQSDLTKRTWMYRPSGPRRLVLVTCAPPYDPATGYQRLAVIVAVPVGAATPRSS